MFCNKCGAENRNDRKFCANCGAPLRDYTKPRENLIMPEEIERKQSIVQSRNKIRLACNILMCVLFVLGVAFTVLSFFVDESWKLFKANNAFCAFVNNNLVWFVIGFAFLFFFAFIVVWAIKFNKIKDLEKK